MTDQDRINKICALTTVGQFIDINNVMPWLMFCLILNVNSFNNSLYYLFMHMLGIKTEGQGKYLKQCLVSFCFCDSFLMANRI